VLFAKDRLDEIDLIIEILVFFVKALMPIRQQYRCLCSPRNGRPFSALWGAVLLLQGVPAAVLGL